jgi:hypothetical protein
VFSSANEFALIAKTAEIKMAARHFFIKWSGRVGFEFDMVVFLLFHVFKIK